MTLGPFDAAFAGLWWRYGALPRWVESLHARLDGGSTHEVPKNFPTRDEAIAAISARNAQWRKGPYYWAVTCELD